MAPGGEDREDYMGRDSRQPQAVTCGRYCDEELRNEARCRHLDCGVVVAPPLDADWQGMTLHVQSPREASGPSKHFLSRRKSLAPTVIQQTSPARPFAPASELRHGAPARPRQPVAC